MTDLLDTLLSHPRLAAYSDSRLMKIGRLVRLVLACGECGRLQMRLPTLLSNIYLGPIRWAALSADLIADRVITLHPTDEGLVDVSIAPWLLPQIASPTPAQPSKTTLWRQSKRQNETNGRFHETEDETTSETGDRFHETPSESDPDQNQIGSESDPERFYIKTSDPDPDQNQIGSDPDRAVMTSPLVQQLRTDPEQWTEAEITEALRRAQATAAKGEVRKPLSYLRKTLRSIRSLDQQQAALRPPPTQPPPKPPPRVAIHADGSPPPMTQLRQATRGIGHG